MITHDHPWMPPSEKGVKPVLKDSRITSTIGKSGLLENPTLSGSNVINLTKDRI